jgi:hypothetical protein
LFRRPRNGAGKAQVESVDKKSKAFIADAKLRRIRDAGTDANQKKTGTVKRRETREWKPGLVFRRCGMAALIAGSFVISGTAQAFIVDTDNPNVDMRFRLREGFRQFPLHGIDNVRNEWTLVCLAWNLKRKAVRSISST